MKKKITIAGAGLVGSLLSIYLAKRGHSVSLHERRHDMRKGTAGVGRSINLALSDRGLLALEKVGLADTIKTIAIPMHGRYIHNHDGSTAFQPYGREGQYINSVSRGDLNKLLMDAAEQSGVEIIFDQKCEHINFNSNSITFTSGEGVKSDHVADIIFGADGAFAATRLQHQLQHEKFDYQQFYIDCGYKELTIPPTSAGDFALEANALHIWPRKDFMLIALPNLDRSFTCTLFFPFEGEFSFASLNTPELVEDFFSRVFPDAFTLMPGLAGEFFSNPTSSLVTVKCYPWVRGGKFALIGDAAHAIVPFFGQGMNCGFEDCRILDELISKEEDENWDAILNAYQLSRKPDADAIADLAVANFIEMRSRTADPVFLLQKKIEAKLHAAYPSEWIPAYTMVTFSPGIRYSEALRKGMEQERIMQQVMLKTGIEDKWDDPMLHEEIITLLHQKN